MQEIKVNKGRGGAREGAGRPKLDTKQIGIRISAEAAHRLEELADEQGCTKSQVIENLLK